MDITPELHASAERLRAVLDAPDFSDERLIGFYARRRPELESSELASHVERVAEALATPGD